MINDTAHQEITRAEAEEFILRESRMLDERRFDEWSELFADDGYYWAPANPDQRDPHDEVSLIYDDREIMKQRIQRLNHPRAYAQIPPSRAVRQVSGFQLDEECDVPGEGTFRSVFFMFEFRSTLPEPVQRIFAGTFHHRLRRTGGKLKIVSKKVMLVNCDATFTPIFLYF